MSTGGLRDGRPQWALAELRAPGRPMVEMMDKFENGYCTGGDFNVSGVLVRTGY